MSIIESLGFYGNCLNELRVCRESFNIFHVCIYIYILIIKRYKGIIISERVIIIRRLLREHLAIFDWWEL